MKKYPRSEMIRSQEMQGEPAYITWNNSNKAKVFASYSRALEECRGVTRASNYRDYSDLASNVSGRPGLSKDDYYKFRPQEAPANTPKGVIAQCDAAYHSVGLVRNIIDLMGDFACQGVMLVHPNKRIEKFYQNWFEKIGGKDRSERFLNNLYRTANVVIRKHTAKIDVPTEQRMYKTGAAPDIKLQKQKVESRVIPWKYIFLNPIHIDIVGGALSSFVGSKRYALTLPNHLRRIINSPKNIAERALVSKLPADIIQAAKNSRAYLLPEDKVSVWHYKKDDWQEWASPMTYAIIDDIGMLEKLKLADMAALDGAISNIRIFKLGNLEHSIAPTRVALAKLAEILESNVGGGTFDLVWGPDIELVESKTSVHQFLGEEKYKPHLASIYTGMGIPPTLTGQSGSGGTTNNYIGLKTLMQRLEYGRSVLVDFWNQEIKEVQKAMGFRIPAKVVFDINILGDEQAEKALLIQLADRSLISDELIQQRFHNDPEMEKIRINREQRERDNGKMVPKSSPFHDPQFALALKKIALTKGILVPSQVGLMEDAVQKQMRTFPLDKKEKNMLAIQTPKTQTPPNSSPSGQPQQGRPRNSKDKTKRKEKIFKPKTKAIVEIWAKAAQLAISEVLTSEFLLHINKKSVRSLTNKEVNTLEKLKFDTLFNLPSCGIVDEETILDGLTRGNVSSRVYNVYMGWSKDISNFLNRKLTVDEQRQIQSCLYASIHGE